MKNKKLIFCFLILMLLSCLFVLASCRRATVTVTIITNNHLEIDPLTGRSGSKINFEFPELENNDFEGLYTDRDYTHYFGKAIRQFPDSDITLYAKYNPHVLFRLSFDTIGGSYVVTQDIYVGENLSEYRPANPVKEGRIFGGWQIKGEDGQFLPFDFDIFMPASDIKLYAKWLVDPSKDYYKFIVDGKLYREEVLEPNTILPVPPNPRLEDGQVFEGWYSEPNTATKFDFNAAVDFSSSQTILDDDGAFCIYGNYYTNGLITEGESVLNYVGSSSKIVVPWSLHGNILREIASSAFSFGRIKNVSLPKTIETVQSRAFYNCNQLTSISFPTTLKFIGNEAFANCTSLAKITIPRDAEVALEDAFAGCSALEEILVEEGSMRYSSHGGAVYSADQKTLIKCAPGRVQFEAREGTLTVLAGAFDSPILKKLTLSDSVQQIERGAIRYQGCKLEELTLPAVANNSYLDGDRQIAIFNLATVFGAQSYFDNMGGSIYLNSLFVPSTLTEVAITKIYAQLSYSFYGCFYIKKITLPNTGLTYIGAGAFYICYNLQEIALPDTVTSISGGSIDKAAFYYCHNLKKITLPFLEGGYLSYIFGASSYDDTLTIDGSVMSYTFFLEEIEITSKTMFQLEDGAFFGNRFLKTISLASQIKRVGIEAFYNCNLLERINTLDYVEELTTTADRYSAAFAYCHNLENLSLPNLKRGIIGKDAFLGTGSFGGSFGFVINEGILAIEDYAFMDCTALSAITIPSTVLYIGVGAFFNCAALKQIVVPPSCMSIGFAAFQGLSGLEYLEIPMTNNVEFALDNQPTPSFFLPLYFGASSLTGNKYKTDEWYSQYVPRLLKTVSFNRCDENVRLHYSFYNCEFIEYINLPDAPTEIGENAFYGCASLRSINISANISSIGVGAFGYCKNLTEFYVSPANLNFTVQDGVLYSQNKTTLISYPAGKRTAEFSIPSGVLHIQSLAFAGNDYIRSVRLPSSLVSVGWSIFQNCLGLQSVTTDSGAFDPISLDNGFLVDSFGRLHAYFGLQTEVHLPQTLSSIEAQVFSNLTYIQKIVIGNQITNIGEYAFEGISAEVVFAPNSHLTNLGEYSFAGYLGSRISLPAGLQQILSCAFENSALQSVSLPSSLLVIGDRAFYNSQNLSELEIMGDSQLQTIGERAFMLCGLKIFTVPKTLMQIGNYAFAYNSIEAFDSMDTALMILGEYSFYCNSLQMVRVSGKIESIGRGAFAFNSPLYSLTLCEGVRRIEDYAFNADIRPFGSNNPLSMLNNIQIPASVEYIGQYAFYGAGHYAVPTGEEGIYWYLTQEVTLTFSNQSRLEEIDDSAFAMMRLSGTLDLSGTLLKKIGASAFANFVGTGLAPDAYSLKNIIFPHTLLHIGSHAFLNQIGLTELIIPAAVAIIEEGAFFQCYNIFRVVIGSAEQYSSIAQIGEHCFGSEFTTSLEVIIFANVPPELLQNSFYALDSVLVPSSLLQEYKEAPSWQDYANIIYPL